MQSIPLPMLDRGLPARASHVARVRSQMGINKNAMLRACVSSAAIKRHLSTLDLADDDVEAPRWLACQNIQ